RADPHAHDRGELARQAGDRQRSDPMDRERDLVGDRRGREQQRIETRGDRGALGSLAVTARALDGLTLGQALEEARAAVLGAAQDRLAWQRSRGRACVGWPCNRLIGDRDPREATLDLARDLVPVAADA